MNNARRKEIAAVQEEIAKAQSILTDAVASLESIRDDERAYFDDMPENFQSGEKGEAAEAAIGVLDGVLDDLESLDLEANALDGAME
jgi:hypothetical protein